MPTNQPIDPRWAWDRYIPRDSSPWDLRKVGHLYRRAAFGATHAELQRGLAQGPDRTVDALLRGGDGLEAFDRETAGRVPSLARTNNGDLATAWWLYRMLYTPHPLREKLALFWHNHFATSNRKVNHAGQMVGQYELLRRHALGSFRTLLTDMSRDPAMMVWLDTVQSRRQAPNENYARELMELFSLGVRDHSRDGRHPNYTEQDVREAARAFTGLQLENGRFVFRPAEHDDTEKNVLGRRGRWGPDDVVRICLEQPSAPYFLVTKLFRFLVSETIPATPALLEPLATEFRRDYDFGALVQRVLRSNLFFSPHAYRSRVKAPVDFALSIVRGLEGRVATLPLVPVLEGLGQRPFYPPSVAGWDGGRAWLNGQTLLSRNNLALALTSTQDDRFGRRADPARTARAHDRRTDEELVGFFLDLFLQGDVAAESRSRLLEYLRQANSRSVPAFWTPEDAADQRVRTLCHLVLTLPEFQLD